MTNSKKLSISGTPKLRVEKVHGGENVEEIVKPVRVNAPTHEHIWEPDPTETDFEAYICTVPNCGAVVLYDKP